MAAAEDINTAPWLTGLKVLGSYAFILSWVKMSNGTTVDSIAIATGIKKIYVARILQGFARRCGISRDAFILEQKFQVR